MRSFSTFTETFRSTSTFKWLYRKRKSVKDSISVKRSAFSGYAPWNGKSYRRDRILTERLVRDVQKAIGIASQKPKLSRRRAFIVILEELYYNVPKYPEGLSLNGIHRRASQRFEYMNRDVKSFTTPTEVHPKDPCTFYEDNAHAKARYRSALQHLVLESHRYFEVPEAETSLEILFENVELC